MNGVSRGPSRRPVPGNSSAERRGTRRAWLARICLAASVLYGAAECSWGQQLTVDPLPSEAVPPSAISESIVDIRIEGNTTIPASAISRHIKTQPNRPASPESIREDVRALYATRWFFSVEPRYRQTDEGLVLIFKVLERPVVRNVEYKGNDKIKTKVLTQITNIKTGSPFDVSANRESARRIEAEYHKKGYAFATVELEKGGSKDDRDVVFLIKEGPKVKVMRVRFLGNEFCSDGLLKTKLRTKTALLGWVGLPWLGGKYDPATIPDDVDSLKQYYNSLGFFDVDIEKRVLFSEDRSKVELEYSINEGTRYKVENVEFVGNRTLSEDDLLDDTKLHAGDYFNSRHLGLDISKIQDQYGRLGRLFAKVEAVPRFREEPGTVDVVYQIDEDRVRRIRRFNVHFEGDYPHTKETVVMNRSLIHPGDLANSRLIERTKSRLEGSQLFERGPGQGVRINITPIEEEGDQLASIRGQSHGTTSIPAPPRPSGSGYYGHSQALKPLTDSLTSPSAPAQRSAVQQPNRRAANTSQSTQSPFASNVQTGSVIFRGQSDNVFDPNNPMFGNSPQGDPLENQFREPPPGWVDLDAYVTEARTGRLMFGVGVNSDAGVVGSIVLDESNFDILRPPTSWSDVINGRAWRGGGQRFRLEAVPGNVVSRYLVSWTDPYFLDTDFSFSVSGFYFNRFYPDWDEDRAGGRFSLGYQFTNEFSMNAALRVENVELKNPDRPTPLIVQEAEGSSLLTTGRVSAAYDTRDSSFLPTEGHLAQMTFEQAFGDWHYPRLEGELRQYFTLFERPDGGGKHVLSIGGQAGWTDSGTPVYERFYAGGFQTFRGFEFRGVSPREFGTRIGGEWMFLGTAEYKLPITADDNIAMVFFSDFGTVEEEVAFDDFRVTVGAGVRLTVPAMGPVPLAFDFAVPLERQDADDTQVFSFYVGINR